MRFAVLCLLGLAAPLAGQTLSVTPQRVLADETMTLRAAGLAASEHITIDARLEDGKGNVWTSRREFTADAQGAIEVSPQDSAMMILLMMPGDKGVASYAPPRDFGTQLIEFRLLRKNEAVATAKLE